MTTIKEIFDAMPASFQKDAAAGMNAVYQFDITGEGGGRYYAAVENGALTVAEGEHAAPNITLTIAAQDYINMSTGKLNPQLAFMTGKIKLKGDMALAMKMAQIFKQ
jgi:putative sterol carrier protein